MEVGNGASGAPSDGIAVARATSRVSVISSNKNIEDTLATMGIKTYEPLVISALAQYARRVASELLLDAKDFSVHAGKEDIDATDVNLAINMYEQKLIGPALSKKRTDAIAQELNSIPLAPIPQHATRVIPNPKENLLKRSFSYVPGSEAYPEVNNNKVQVVEDASSNGTYPSSGNMGTQSLRKNTMAKPPITITLGSSAKASADANKTASI